MISDKSMAVKNRAISMQQQTQASISHLGLFVYVSGEFSIS